MSAKLVLVSCSVALLAQSAFSACSAGLPAPCGLAGNGLGGYGSSFGGCGCGGISSYGSYGAGLGGCGGVASTGGGLPVASASPIAPVGISLVSENFYEGNLSAGGNLPFLGTVGIEGVVPTAGAGAVSYGSGSGAIGITSEGIVGPDLYGPGVAGYGLSNAGYGLGGIGCGRGGIGLGIGGQGCGCGSRYI